MTSSDLTSVCVVVLTFLIFLYMYGTRKFNHWKKKKVPYITPIPFFGNVFEVLTARRHVGELFRSFYESTTEPFLGFFICDRPCLLIREPNLIKSILIQDSDIFADRNTVANEKVDPIAANTLLIARYPASKNLRRKLTPVFSSARLKAMHTLLMQVGADLVKYLEEEIDKNPIVDCKDMASKYSVESISSTSFGLNTKCFEDSNAEFLLVARRILDFSILERAISTSFYFLFPRLVKLFRLKFIDKASADFLRTAFWKTMKEREERKIVRNDLIDILIQMKKEINVDDPFQLEGDKIVAQAVSFLVAGFETTMTAISFTLYEFAVNPAIQKMARREVEQLLGKYGDISYTSVSEMEFLETCVKETLRKYPVLPFLDRKCNSDYKLPGTDVIVEKGTPVFVSTFGLHYDANYYPNPEKYDPTRFSEENFKQIPFAAYLPFGEGPHICLGMRYGLMTTKTAIAYIISKFEVKLCEKTQHPIKFGTRGFALAPASAVYLKMEKIINNYEREKTFLCKN